MGSPWYGGNFCPTLIIDLIWHASMMMPLNYYLICTYSHGMLIPHCSAKNEDKHNFRFGEFIKYYEHIYKSSPIKVDDLHLGNENACEIILKEIEDREQKKRERDERQKFAHKQQIELERLEKERLKRENPYEYNRRYSRPSFDDGKC